ncbi:GGDEF domain-containing protein [Alteromonas sp. McT4-15]|uniref:GGDEF domain-containing protein n=1 Tax=Alteromonas sp. McT4-15 TaxID=2881256 RepID=UPI001CF920EC|nr:GGDEF domain-containing protein [Alteromonas sp. McT4-15]MCB4437421.1 GGDEF domain-containing protein [Alteromonas sp. McT4-15]
MFDRLFDGSLMPHGHCLLWRWDLLFLHLGGDLMTVVAYSVIPLGIFYFLYKRKDIKFDGLAALFACFIAFCGLSHLAGIVNIWNGYYFIEGAIKFATGFVSIVTAYYLWKLMPVFINIPSITMLEERNKALEELRAQLEEANHSLEEKVKERTLELEQQANTDAVTGVASRFCIMETLNHNCGLFERYGRPFSILMIDVDHFKDVNDTHGHQAGDEVLSLMAECISNNIRSVDAIGRYGGEEFLVILPETPQSIAIDLAERIRIGVEKLSLPFEIEVTCSVGVSTMTHGMSDDGLVSQADHALYTAKRSGRNQVVVFKEGMSEGLQNSSAT